MLTDVLGRPVDTGDEVVLLCKERSYRGLKDAYLGHAIYLGEGSWGHEFVDYKKRDEEDPTPIRIKKPECVKISKTTNWIKFNRESFATNEDWETVCEEVSADPENTESIKIYIDSSEIMEVEQ